MCLTPNPLGRKAHVKEEAQQEQLSFEGKRSPASGHRGSYIVGGQRFQVEGHLLAGDTSFREHVAMTAELLERSAAHIRPRLTHPAGNITDGRDKSSALEHIAAGPLADLGPEDQQSILHAAKGPLPSSGGWSVTAFDFTRPAGQTANGKRSPCDVLLRMVLQSTSCCPGRPNCWRYAEHPVNIKWLGSQVKPANTNGANAFLYALDGNLNRSTGKFVDRLGEATRANRAMREGGAEPENPSVQHMTDYFYLVFDKQPNLFGAHQVFSLLTLTFDFERLRGPLKVNLAQSEPRLQLVPADAIPLLIEGKGFEGSLYHRRLLFVADFLSVREVREGRTAMPEWIDRCLDDLPTDALKRFKSNGEGCSKRTKALAKSRERQRLREDEAGQDPERWEIFQALACRYATPPSKGGDGTAGWVLQDTRQRAAGATALQ